MPSDGSSSSSSRGLAISARPMASICCSPPDIVPAFCFVPLLQPREQREDPLQVLRRSAAAPRRAVGAQVEVLPHRHPGEAAPALRGQGDARG